VVPPSDPPAPPPSNPVAPPAAAAPICAAPALTLDTGHIDAFNVTAQNGQLTLQLKEDVTGSHVLRSPEAVLLKVKEQAYNGAIPASFPGSPSGYVLPLTQNSNLIWPGWDTNGTSGSGFTDVTINVTSATGPGRVHLYAVEGFGAVKSLLQGGGFALPGSMRELAPAHTHAQWTFTERGVYKLTANAVATNPATGASIRSAPRTYVIQVGDAPLGDAFCGLNVSETTVSTAAAAGGRTTQDAAAVAAQAAAAAAAAAAAEAAEQTAAAEAAEDKKRLASADDTPFSPIVDALRSGSPSAYGILIGGGLMIVGIVIGTIWYIRRRHRALESL
jgi:surface-anchored protein